MNLNKWVAVDYCTIVLCQEVEHCTIHMNPCTISWVLSILSICTYSSSYSCLIQMGCYQVSPACYSWTLGHHAEPASKNAGYCCQVAYLRTFQKYSWVDLNNDCTRHSLQIQYENSWIFLQGNDCVVSLKKVSRIFILDLRHIFIYSKLRTLKIGTMLLCMNFNEWVVADYLSGMDP